MPARPWRTVVMSRPRIVRSIGYQILLDQLVAARTPIPTPGTGVVSALPALVRIRHVSEQDREIGLIEDG